MLVSLRFLLPFIFPFGLVQTVPLRHVMVISHLGLLWELRNRAEYSGTSAIALFGHLRLGYPQLMLSLELRIVGFAFGLLIRVLPLASWHLQSYQRRRTCDADRP